MTDHDPKKGEANSEKHGLSLSDFRGFDGPPTVFEDGRRDYGEVRFRAVGRIAGSGYCVVYTIRNERVRLISFRRAHEKELRRHGQ